METFALDVFDKAECQDSQNPLSNDTIQLWLSAACFLQVCSQFHDDTLPPDFAEKARFAKFKATQAHKKQKDECASNADKFSSSVTSPASNSDVPLMSSPASNSNVPLKNNSTADVTSRDPEISEPQKIKAAQRLCEHAISALSFSDFKTAMDKLKDALEIIRPFSDC
eukprot:GHVL01032874.1.p1 GENE.GHVL01032874.1~~GHVL01032874.1.p1  ORF type:complete len:168 (+),score=29.46 GHVL01032874.1:297-800(+)